jgi:membrane associated rhomboid family serine protease
MIIVLRTPSRRVFDEGTLVLKALEIPFERASHGGLYELLVHDEHAARASRELVEYLNEDPLVPEQLATAARRGRPWPGALLYAVIVMTVFHLADRHIGFDWWRAGVLDAAAVRAGEWWRTITALTLHTGLDHIASNLVFGAFFGALLAEATGNGLGWALFVMSGWLGNAANVLVRGGADHRAVGASTAIFGALGALAAHEWARGWTDARDVARRWAPLVGGVMLLGFLGGGGENTDVLAHVTGFVCGLGLGYLGARLRPLREAGPRMQTFLAILAVAIVVGGWVAALSA